MQLWESLTDSSKHTKPLEKTEIFISVFFILINKIKKF